MKDLRIEAKVTGGKDGKFFYAETHEWHNIEEMAWWLMGALSELDALVSKLEGNKSRGDLVATLTQVIDGTPTTKTYGGLTPEEVNLVEGKFASLYAEIVAIARVINSGKRVK